MTKVINWIVDIIMSFINKIWYNIRVEKLKKEVVEAKEKVDEVKTKSDAAVNRFRVKLKQYRKSRGTDLRHTVERVRARSGDAGDDNRHADNVDAGTGKGDKGAGRGSQET